MNNSFAYVSITVGRCSIKKTALLVSSSRYMFRGNSDACVTIAVELQRTKKLALLTLSLHSQMASAFISYSYQIYFESVLMIHDHEGMVNMFKALEASGLRRFLGCESILYETELGHFFDTALIQDEEIICVISGKFVSISPTMFAKVFDLPTEGITNFSEVPKDKVYDARSLFSQKGVQIDVHGKKKYMKHEFRLLNDILAKAITVKAGSFDSVTVERFQMMTAIQYGLKVNWGKVLFTVLKDMVDRSQKKAKGFAAQIGVLLKGIPAITMGDGVPFPSAKVLSMRTVHTYIVTNTTIDARTESEEPGMARTPKAKKKPSSADELTENTRHHDVTIIFSFNDLNRHDDVSSAKSCKWKDMMTSSVLIFANGYRDKISQHDPISGTIIRPVFLMNGVWTPVQGPEFWSSSCNLSLFLDNLQMPGPAIQEIFVPLISFIEPDQYWATVPWLMRTWRWTKICEEVVAFNLSGGLRPVRKDACYDITVFNLGVERIPADFLHVFAQGLASHNFVNSVVQKDLGDTEEVVLTGVEDVDLVSSDVSTVYRSPSPPSPGVDSLEHDLRFALGPAIFSRVGQEERFYFVQSPDSPPAFSPHHESSSSSTDVSLHFDSTDVPVHAQAATHAPASVDVTKLAEILEDLQSSLTQRIHDSNCEMISKLNSVELGVRGDLLKMQSLLRQSFETACRVLERQSNTHTAQLTDLKKGLMGPVGTIFGDLFDIKKKQREQDARLLTMDEQIDAIRNEHLEFQSKIAADMLSLSTQVGDIADFLRSGVAKNGEMGSSSRTTTVRAQTQTLPPTTGTFEERVAQARRHIIDTGQVISIEEAAE
ncbi:hypothetical protein F511_12684 [Dorcoceras hygrometricum]|uniref:Dystroglycan-like n=1 Tax=Dorcoceras hygrometricum TaxID=472368 RepID=A0A2Z7D7E6_9LAMI|nr:hypothetical protein F511_12684 [Dorcoceras hygrometricum]